MKIDIEKLKEALQDLYAEEAERIDNTTKNDNLAIKRLTASETRQIKDMEVIDTFIYLAQNISERVKDKPEYKDIIS